MEVTKVFKPEISKCPLCNHKLKYRYTVSNKLIQFYQGEHIRIKNLGYSCTNDNCIDNKIIYTSQTASKMCIKGYTYSAKVLAYITYLKLKHYSRESICNRLALNGIDISDRNIDIIFEKYMKFLEIDYKSRIKEVYKKMVESYGQIRISIDSIVICDTRVISVRNSFNNEQIGLHFCDKTKISDMISLLKEYVSHEKLKAITTVRKITNFFKMLDEAVGRKIEYLHFEKI